MAIRQFKLLNGQGGTFNLNQYGYAWLHDPDGLGWAQNVENVRAGNGLVTIQTYEEVPSPEGEIIFRNYQAYKDFLDFVQVGDLVLGYMPLGTWQYLDCVVQLGKSEIKPTTNRLICPITFVAKSFWYESLQIYQTSGEILESDKKYDYEYAYTYGDAGAGSVTVYNGQLPSFFKVTMLGPMTNPSWRVMVGGSIYKEGSITATIPAGNKLVVDTYPATMEIAEYTMANEFVRDLYGYSDFTTERIFQLPPGESVVVLTDDSLSVPTGWLEVKKRV